MMVTIELKPETERRLAERARQKNLKIESFLEVFIEENLDDVKVPANNEEKPLQKTETYEEWSARFHEWLDSHKDKNYPTLPDEAYSRESIY